MKEGQNENMSQKRHNLSINKYLKKIVNSKTAITLRSFFSKYSLLCFFIGLYIYMELLFRLWSYKNLDSDFLFPVLFAIPAGAFIYIVTYIFPAKAERYISTAITLLVSICYGVQLIYYCIFQTPLSLVSVGGAGDALQFQDIIWETIFKNIIAVILVFMPIALIQLLYGKKTATWTGSKRKVLPASILLCFTSFAIAFLCVLLTGNDPSSQNTLYFEAISPDLSVEKLGVYTSMRLDLERLTKIAIDDRLNKNKVAEKQNEVSNGSASANNDNMQDETAANETTAAEEENNADGEAQNETVDTDVPAEPAEPVKPYNTMDIDFETLIASGQDEKLISMHKYFSSVEPTKTNEYTGMFKGCNLIMMTCEGFSPYVISPELTPMLYEMSTTGFVFNNFYTPLWWVSTSDGEYVACTSLLPKSGVWSFSRSSNNYMPFCLGNQFRKLGYLTKAYHDHTYTYYDRDSSHPNMGYDYKGLGNGLDIKKTWPESDLEMINATVDEYIDQQPFHVYYMTVSGHMNYNFGGNQMAAKNRKYVEDLPYSDTCKAYIACNLELEFALESLVNKLEEAGIAENTVIAMSADHYPYGMEKKYLDELAGHEVEDNFEKYRNKFILWKKGMTPVTVDKPCSSVDILPTISNLFGLEYDSRLLIGRDILCDDPAFVLFSNRSWITDRAYYNSKTKKVTFTDGTVKDDDYVNKINKRVANQFTYSQKILDTDYYNVVIPHDQE